MIPIFKGFFQITKRKSLTCELLTQTVVARVNPKVKDRAQLLFNGQDVQQVKALVVKIINDGNIPVSLNDFDSSLLLSFGIDTLILSGDVATTYPSNMNPKIEFESNRVSIHPLSLNAQDYIIIRVFLNNYGNLDRIDVVAKIDGIKQIRKVTNPWQAIEHAFRIRLWWGAVLSTGVALATLGLANWLFPSWSIVICLWFAFLSMAGTFIRARRLQTEHEAEIDKYFYV